MRLTEGEIQTILQSIRRFFPDAKRILLFGSRRDDTKRGGDIDLLVETLQPAESRYRKAAQAVASIQLLLGERKIDLVLAYPEGSEEDRMDNRSIVQVARQTGIPLEEVAGS
jgi:predicted nucleotidyltransferase